VRAKVEAEVQEAQAKAAQAGPLAQAQASQNVIAAQTALAERETAPTEKRLESQVRRPADAEAYKQRTLAEAARDAVMHNTEGEAFKQRAMAEANRDTTKLNTEAEASRRRSLAEAVGGPEMGVMVRRLSTPKPIRRRRPFLGNALARRGALGGVARRVHLGLGRPALRPRPPRGWARLRPLRLSSCL